MITEFSPLEMLKQKLPDVFGELKKLIPAERKLALAISGGSDSMLLAFLILTFWADQGRNQTFLFFLHCNHQMRKESDDEQVFLQNFFKNHNFSVFTRAEAGKANEAQLRARRYGQFRTFMQENTIDTLLTGHNLTDRIESSVLNMLRGCGIKGFLSMKTEQTHDLLDEKLVLRPLLTLSKEKIKKLADDLGIPYFIDETNLDDSTSKRNLIRNQFLTPLANLSPQSNEEKAFWNSRKHIYTYLEQETVHKELFLRSLKLNPYRGAAQAYEREIPSGLPLEKSLDTVLSALNIPISKGEYLELCKGFENSSDGNWRIGERQIFLAHQRKYFIKAKAAFREKTLTLEKKVTEIGIQTFGLFQIEVGPELLGATIRFPRANDAFHSKSLKKRMLNQKIPIFRRNTLPLAEKDGNIILVWRPEMLIF